MRRTEEDFRDTAEKLLHATLGHVPPELWNFHAPETPRSPTLTPGLGTETLGLGFVNPQRVVVC